ncbi:hypothetical protein [Haloactinopolyspora alba]|uniref:hypothetical protein n=1 Tax=Haloactinopolyspora alba TaxID=648780 RepID=UPI00101E0AB8|nr:hypothetical protein [Haloactinopolyspora alba]
MRTGHRILLVGPWRAGTAGGGCCTASPEDIGIVPHEHPPHDPGRDDAGGDDGPGPAAVVRALRASVGPEVDVQLVDPRNTVYLVPTVFRDARAGGASAARALATAARATTPWTLVADGVVVSRAVPLDHPSALACLPPDIPRTSTTR